MFLNFFLVAISTHFETVSETFTEPSPTISHLIGCPLVATHSSKDFPSISLIAPFGGRLPSVGDFLFILDNFIGADFFAFLSGINRDACDFVL